jgi:Protein of unknown function (DUF2442)
MSHPIYRIIDFEIMAPYTLRVEFDDGEVQIIDFQPILIGTLYGPLQDRKLFESVEIDPEVHTLVWPNGADFDPATLHDWPLYAPEMQKMVERWRAVDVETAV